MSDTPIYDKLFMEFQEPGKSRHPAREEPEPMQEEVDEASQGDPDAEYDRKVDEELSDG